MTRRLFSVAEYQYRSLGVVGRGAIVTPLAFPQLAVPVDETFG